MSENKKIDKLKPAPQPGDEFFRLLKEVIPEGTPPDSMTGHDAVWERMIVTPEGPVKLTKIEAGDVAEDSCTWISLKRRGKPKIEAAIHHHAYEDRDAGIEVSPSDLDLFTNDEALERGVSEGLSPEERLGRAVAGLSFDRQVAGEYVEEILSQVRVTPQEFWQTARNP